jgi:hypothetical protein
MSRRCAASPSGPTLTRQHQHRVRTHGVHRERASTMGRRIYALRVPSITDDRTARIPELGALAACVARYRPSTQCDPSCSIQPLPDLQPAAEVREGRFELPSPFGHRILRLPGPRTKSRSKCRSVSSDVVLCPRMSPVVINRVAKRAMSPGPGEAVSLADLYWFPGIETSIGTTVSP